MAGFHSDHIRNIALLGHAGSGKTSLAEALLARVQGKESMGSVLGKNTISDYSDLEKQAGHSLETSLLHLIYQPKKSSKPAAPSLINLLDTPGYKDLFGRAMSVLPAVETVAIVINARNGVEAVSKKAWKLLKECNKCGLIIVNQIDDPEADLPAVIEEIRQQLGEDCLPINLPCPDRTVVDCYFEPEDKATLFSSVEQAHSDLVDQVVEMDEQLMEVYLEQGQNLKPEQLHDPFESALRQRHLIPVCFTSAITGAGIDSLLRVISELMPTPLEGNPPEFLLGEGEDAAPFTLTHENTDTDNHHVIAHVFKLTMDPFMGKLGVFRVHQGIVRNGSQLFVGDGRKPLRISHMVKLQGSEHISIEEAHPGDICAIAKADSVFFDAVLHDSHEEDHFHLLPLEFPTPMVSEAIAPTRQGDEQKMSDVLHKMAAEDPSLKIEFREQQNETVILGLGDIHLNAVCDKMAQTYKMEVSRSEPTIPYKETISGKAQATYRHKKQTGGAGQFGEVSLRIEPLETGGGFEFINAIVGGVIPGSFIPAVEKGVREVLAHGAVAGFPLQDVRVTLFDGKHHSVDSKEIAFVSAGKKAFIEAVENASPVILEPYVNLEIVVPASATGDVTGDLAGNRGMVTGTETRASGKLEIHAKAPLASLRGYSSRLKSFSGGEGEYSMELSHYEAVPLDLQKQLVAAFSKEKN
ncbi:elongation factor G [Pelagibaculum spongiae]|uniref:Elongation factor G n=1 Tax=Pelagibaculum spongiae TaxID=2080658 RepID=A0A2V1GUT0_9GAMM|nr:elongation factor G [Pelagibaculum spongiae]PVZ69769.1 elongation factor G [Pelagibaculum spongiae]